jgi:ankyrin repeat protein
MWEKTEKFMQRRARRPDDGGGAAAYETDEAEQERLDHELWVAAHEQSNDRVMELMGAGADPRRPNWVGVTALMLAAQSCSRATMDAMIERGEVDAKDDDGETALMAAAFHGNLAAIGALLAAGADPSAKKIGSEWTVLHISAMCKDARSARMLAPLCDLDARDCNGESAEALAAKHGMDETLGALRQERARREREALAEAVGEKGADVAPSRKPLAL